MPNSQEQFLDLYRSNLDAMANVARVALDEAERLQMRQLEGMRAAFEGIGDLAREVAGARTVEALMAVQTRVANRPLELALGYWAKVVESANHAQLETVKRMEEETSRMNDRWLSFLDSAPAGSETLVAAMKSMITTAHAAYSAGAQVTEQAARLTEVQVGTATAGIRKALAGPEKRAA